MQQDITRFFPQLTGRIAVAALIDIAEHQSERSPVSLYDIAERTGFSLSYLEQIFARLRRAGIVESTRGPGGGYRLAKAAEQINLAEVIAVAGPKKDERADEPLRAAWQHVGLALRNQLAAISLGDLQHKYVAARN